MITIDGIEIKLEGSFKTLISEVARAMHAIAKAVTDEFEEDSDGEISYDHVVETILDDLVQYRKMDNGHLPGLPEEVIKDFHDQLKALRKRDDGSDPSFIDFDTSRPTAEGNRSLLKGIIKDAYADERTGLLDMDDLKAIKKSQKSQKKNKK